MKERFKRLSRNEKAFSLLEVVIALGITSICLISVLGLFSVGITMGQNSAEQLQAYNIGQSLLATYRDAPSTASSISGFPLPSLTSTLDGTNQHAFLDENGLISLQPNNAYYGLTYRILPISFATSTTPSVYQVYLCISWPAQAQPANTKGRCELLGQIHSP